MARTVLTLEFARAAAIDAANARMRKAGRARWNRADYRHAVKMLRTLSPVAQTLMERHEARLKGETADA